MLILLRPIGAELELELHDLLRILSAFIMPKGRVEQGVNIEQAYQLALESNIQVLNPNPGIVTSVCHLVAL